MSNVIDLDNIEIIENAELDAEIDKCFKYEQKYMPDREANGDYNFNFIKNCTITLGTDEESILGEPKYLRPHLECSNSDEVIIFNIHRIIPIDVIWETSIESLHEIKCYSVPTIVIRKNDSIKITLNSYILLIYIYYFRIFNINVNRKKIIINYSIPFICLINSSIYTIKGLNEIILNKKDKVRACLGIKIPNNFKSLSTINNEIKHMYGTNIFEICQIAGLYKDGRTLINYSGIKNMNISLNTYMYDIKNLLQFRYKKIDENYDDYDTLSKKGGSIIKKLNVLFRRSTTTYNCVLSNLLFNKNVIIDNYDIDTTKKNIIINLTNNIILSIPINELFEYVILDITNLDINFNFDGEYIYILMIKL